MSRPLEGICGCCGEPGDIVAYGWRSACYFRWYRARKAGQQVDSPPPRMRLRRADRLAEYAFLRDAGESPQEAGRRVGIRNVNTIHRYEVDRTAMREQAVA